MGTGFQAAAAHGGARAGPASLSSFLGNLCSFGGFIHHFFRVCLFLLTQSHNNARTGLLATMRSG